MKKILFVCNHMLGGGAERVAALLMNRLSVKYDVSLAVLYEQGSDYYLNNNIRIHNLCKSASKNRLNNWIYFFSRTLELKRLIKQEKPAIIISFLARSNISALLAAKSFGKLCKVIVTEHGPVTDCLPETKKPILLYLLRNFIYNKVDYLVGVSKGVTNNYGEVLRLPSNKLITIYNPLEIDDITKKSKEMINHPWFKNKRCPILLAIGRLCYQKGFDILIESFKKVRQEQEVKLIILGKGPDYDKLKNLIDLNKLSNDVDMIGFEKNPFKYMKNADILVISSRWEGFPCVLEEAMCVGTPIISTDCNFGPNEIIQNNKNGILVKPEDPAELYLVIKKLLNDKKLQNKFKINSKAYSKQFDINEVVKKYVSLIN